MSDATRRIALVLDSPVLEHLFAQGCAPLRVSLSSHSSRAPELLNELAEQTPQLIVHRRSAEWVDGRPLAEVLRADPRLRGCRIILASTGPPGQGRVFGHAHLALPCTPEQIRMAVRAQLSAKPVVLVVDDSRAHRRWVSGPLLEAGWAVREAEDGAAALRSLDAEGPVDLVLSDVEMPEMDGFALCGAIKDDPARAMTPVVLVTSHNSSDAIARGYAVGADDYVTKPVVPGELLSRVRRLVTARQQRRNERLLLLDPQPRRARALLGALVAQGFSVEAVEAPPGPGQPFGHLLILDEDMLERVNLNRLIAHSEAVEAPVLVVTGHEPGRHTAGAQAAIARLTTALGGDHFSVVARPYSPDRLLAEVERLLSFARIARQRTLLRRYLSGDALQALEGFLESGSRAPAAAARQRTVLFADLVGFTRLCEQRAAGEVVRILNAFFDATVPTLVQHGASIDKFIGDCILAVFDGDSAGAVGAVGGAAELLGRVLPALRGELGLDLHVRVGIHSGEVVMGDVGSRDFRRDFTVIGDTVNVAQRIQTAAEVDEVLVSAPTARLLSGVYPLGDARALALKGRVGEMEVWPVRWQGAAAPPAGSALGQAT